MKNKQKKKIEWTKQQEDLLISWAEKSSGYAWLHEKTVHYYKRNNLYIAIPSSIFSYIAGATTLLSDETFNVGWMRGLVGISAILAGIAANFQHMFKYRELSEQHRITSLRFLSFFRDISCELSMHPKHRTDPIDYINLKRMEFDKILEQSPQIPNNIIEQFNIRTENISGSFHKPEVTNILQTIIPYRELPVNSNLNTPNTINTPNTSNIPNNIIQSYNQVNKDLKYINKLREIREIQNQQYVNRDKKNNIKKIKTIIQNNSILQNYINKYRGKNKNYNYDSNGYNNMRKSNYVDTSDNIESSETDNSEINVLTSTLINYFLTRKYYKRWKNRVRKKIKKRIELHKKNKGLNIEVANSQIGSDNKSKTYIHETSSSSTRDDLLLYGLAMKHNNTTINSPEYKPLENLRNESGQELDLPNQKVFNQNVNNNKKNKKNLELIHNNYKNINENVVIQTNTNNNFVGNIDISNQTRLEIDEDDGENEDYGDNINPYLSLDFDNSPIIEKLN